MRFGHLVLSLLIPLGIHSFQSPALAADAVSLLNVSYNPTRELYQEFNAAFATHWRAKAGQTVTLKESHGGSSKQACAVILPRDPESSTGTFR